MRLAVSTVPPRTTSFIPSTTELPATLPTRGCTRLLRASISLKKVESMMEGKREEEEGSKKRGLIWGDSEGILVLG